MHEREKVVRNRRTVGTSMPQGTIEMVQAVAESTSSTRSGSRMTVREPCNGIINGTLGFHEKGNQLVEGLARTDRKRRQWNGLYLLRSVTSRAATPTATRFAIIKLV